MKSKFIWGVIIVLILISAISGFYIWRFQSNRGLDLEISAPEEILRGVPYDIQVSFINNSGAVLEGAVLTFVLPEGAAFLGSDSQKTIDNKSLGNVGAGSLIQEVYKVILFADGGEEKEFKASVSYSPVALSARFEKNKTISVRADASGVITEIDLPEMVVNGEEFEIKVSYFNVSEVDFSNLELRIEYPPSFSFKSSSLKPDEDNNIWNLGDLRKNSEGDFMVRGSIIGAENDIFDFKSFLSLRAAGQIYIVDEKSIPTIISSSPLTLAIRLSDGLEYVALADDDLNYTISYVNNTNDNLSNIVIRAQLLGEMFDINTLQTSGTFRLADNMLIWTSANDSSLTLLSPGSAGVVSFNIKTKNAYPVRRFSDKNFTLQVSAEVESRGAFKVFSKARTEIKVRGDLVIDAKGFFRDAESGILNYGVMPPKAGQKTNFTVHWILKSFASDISDIEVSAALGDNIKMVGQPKSNVGSVPFFDSHRNQVIWEIGRIQANRGVVGEPIEAIFQVEAVPSAEQVGTYMNIIGDTFIKGIDEWTGEEVLNNDILITTALPDDSTVVGQGGVVQP